MCSLRPGELCSSLAGIFPPKPRPHSSGWPASAQRASPRGSPLSWVPVCAQRRAPTPRAPASSTAQRPSSSQPGPCSWAFVPPRGMLRPRSYWPALPGSSILQRLLCFLTSGPPFPVVALVVSPGGSAFILRGAKAAQRGGGQCKASLLQGTEVDRSRGRESSLTLCWHCLTWERPLVPVWCDPVCGSEGVLPVPPAQPCPWPCSRTARAQAGRPVCPVTRPRARAPAPFTLRPHPH